MGILDRLGLGKSTLDLANRRASILSPWASDGTDMGASVTAEILGIDVDKLPIGRGEAIKIPAVSKARNLLIATICKFALEALNAAKINLDGTLQDGALVDPQPTFLYRTNGPVSPQERLAWSIDDMIFYGYTLWLVERGAGGAILKADRCPMSRWTITKGHILVDEQPVDEEEVLLFNSPFEGLLRVGSTTLRGARDTERAWTSRMQTPAYMTELRVTDDTLFGDQKDIDEWLAYWAQKHQAGQPSVGLTPAGMELNTHAGNLGEADLFLENRNAIRTDVGSFLNLRASMLDGTTGIDSLTYSTTQGEKNSFYEFDLPFWTDPFEWRLSMDDVVPRGQRVRFNKYSEYDPAAEPTGAPEED